MFFSPVRFILIIVDPFLQIGGAFLSACPLAQADKFKYIIDIFLF